MTWLITTRPLSSVLQEDYTVDTLMSLGLFALHSHTMNLEPLTAMRGQTKDKDKHDEIAQGLLVLVQMRKALYNWWRQDKGHPKGYTVMNHVSFF